MHNQNIFLFSNKSQTRICHNYNFIALIFQKVRTFTAPNYSVQHNQKSTISDSEIAGDSNKILKSTLSRPVLVDCSKSGQRTLD